MSPACASVGRHENICCKVALRSSGRRVADRGGRVARATRFTRGWADGWRALLKKLDSISTPRSLANAAPLAASSFPRGDDLVNGAGEQLLTNIIRVK
ncbi:MAG: hypothetical protein HY674_17195, partial [Chloroflexi bacterium]|nr:hypothetical protein [Chloroflexota bacterium]